MFVDQYFDRALCFTSEGYQQYTQLQSGFESRASEGQYLIR